MINQINEAIKNQSHLNLDVIPEEKMKQEKKVAKKVEKKPAAFRGRESKKRDEGPQRPKRNRGIKRR